MYSDTGLLSPSRRSADAAPRRHLRRWVAAALGVCCLVAGTLWYGTSRQPAADPSRLAWPAVGAAALSVDGRIVAGPQAAAVVPIASVAKVMTAYVVLRDHPLEDGDDGPVITVSRAEAAAYPRQQAAGESLVRVDPDEQLDERQALEALLLPSADNMAWMLARWDAGDQQGFLTRMNAQARRLHMRSTTYTDASGLAASTVSTARDQLLLAAAALTIPALAAIVAEPTATIPVAGLVRNYNTLLGQDGIVGLKTGSTSAAGGCLLVAARTQLAGRQVLVIGAVLGQPGKGRAMLAAALQAGHRLVMSAATGTGEQAAAG